MEGLEPPHLTASDPKSDVSTNFTTCAFGAAKVNDLGQKMIGMRDFNFLVTGYPASLIAWKIFFNYP